MVFFISEWVFDALVVERKFDGLPVHEFDGGQLICKFSLRDVKAVQNLIEVIGSNKADLFVGREGWAND